jgi:hypothetical protein
MFKVGLNKIGPLALHRPVYGSYPVLQTSWGGVAASRIYRSRRSRRALRSQGNRARTPTKAATPIQARVLSASDIRRNTGHVNPAEHRTKRCRRVIVGFVIPRASPLLGMPRAGPLCSAGTTPRSSRGCSEPSTCVQPLGLLVLARRGPRSQGKAVRRRKYPAASFGVVRQAA